MYFPYIIERTVSKVGGFRPPYLSKGIHVAWIAAILELTAKWLVGNKMAYGFAVHIVSGILWTIWALYAPDMDAKALLVITIPAFAINVRNMGKWLREKE